MNMKELLNQKLANPSQTPYSKGGDIFMEGKPDMPANSQSTNPEHAEKIPVGQAKPVSAEVQAAARELLKFRSLPLAVRRSAEQIAMGKNVPLVAGGAPESETVEEASRRLREVAAKREAGGKGSPKPESDQQPEGGFDTSKILDKEAASLIKKFNEENGIQSTEETTKLKFDLTKRVMQLHAQRLSISADTEEGKKQIAELESQIAQLQNISSQLQEVLNRQAEKTDQGERVSSSLKKQTEVLLAEVRASNPDLDLNNLEGLSLPQREQRASLAEKIDAYIEMAPPIESGHFDSEILLAVRYFKELRERFASQIIFRAYEERTEMNQYEINLYASSNLDILLGFMSRDDPEAYKYYFSLKTAAQFFHTMNSSILAGNFESYSRVAENISYQHFANMEGVRGSGLVMRLFEQKYKDYLAKDKRITEEGYDDLKREIESIFREMNKKGLIRSEYEQYRKGDAENKSPWKMDEWEINKALGAGRTFFNITLRGGENIATGQLPDAEDRKRFASFPQEDIVRILNWNEWFLKRFKFGENRKGLEFQKMVLARYQEFLRYKGEKLGVNAITEFGGVDVGKMENGSQYKTSGVYSGWRLENMAFDKIRFKPEGEQKTITVMEFMDHVKISPEIFKRLENRKIINSDPKKLRIKEIAVGDALKAIKDRIKKIQEENPNLEPKDAVEKEDQELYGDILKPLVDNLDIGLSMFIKNQNTGGVGKLGYLFRRKVWEKVAETNTPLMIDYLTRLKAKGAGIKSLEEIRDEGKLKPKDGSWEDRIKTKSSNGEDIERTRWEVFIGKFKEKVLLRYERTIREAMGEQIPPLTEEEEYSPDGEADEKELVKRIKEEGSKLAIHLADIVFPYTPFMNDMPFESFDYKGPGQTFYKRRTGGDLGGFNKGQQAFMKLMSNPGGLDAKAATEAMGEIVAGIEGPEGSGTAQEANFANFHALLDILITKPGERQAMLKMLLESTRTPTSIAQEWAGIKAESFTEGEASTLLDQSVRQGIVSPDIARYLKKKKHLTLPFILWMLFRDVFIVTVPVSIATELYGAVKGK